ncbi:hypothetical protein PINS_up020390 [Pythium insidiosum]|nr:hypothetical protein PINS_up020390 [Pythium insidiosum]
MTNRLVLHTQHRLGESDIVTLEATVKKMSQDRERQRNGAVAGNTASANGRSGGSDGHGRNTNGPCGDDTTLSPMKTRRGVELPAELQSQDEWVLLNALTLVEYEKDKTREKEKHVEKQHMQRAWLDAQRAEKEAMKSQEKEQQQRAFHTQIHDLSKWKEQESAKKQHQQEQIMKVRQERDEQLRQQKLRQDELNAKRRQEEEAEVQRVQRELQLIEQEAQKRRQKEMERMRKLQEENAREQQAKQMIKAKEQDEDVKLMEAYARRLAKEEEDRMRALQSKLQRRDMLQNTAATRHDQLRKKELEDERRAEEYQRKKDEETRRKEEEAQERRRRDALERKQFLELQRRQKKEREYKDVEEDLVYAKHVQSIGREAKEEQKRRAFEVRQHNRKLQDLLIEQIAEQKKDQPISPLHLPRGLMNSRERALNAKLLQKLEEPEMTQSVLQKLSPSKEQKEYTISTSFY